MKICKINNQNTKNNQSFKGVNIYRNSEKIISLGIISSNSLADDAVHFFNNGATYLLANTQNAKKLTDMVKDLGENITANKNMEKVRELLSKLFKSDIMPEIEAKQSFELHGKNYNFTYKEIIGETGLADIELVVRNGKPDYIPKGLSTRYRNPDLAIRLD